MRVHWRRLGVVAADLLALAGAYALSFLLRFDFSIDSYFLGRMFQTMPLILLSYSASFYSFDLYRGLYRFASFDDLLNIIKATIVAALASAAIILFLRQGLFPRSVLVMQPVLVVLLVSGVRFSIRLVKTTWAEPAAGPGLRRILLIGADDLAESVLRQLRQTPGCRVIGMLDEDSEKWGMLIHGVAILGDIEQLPRFLRKNAVDEIIVAVENQRGDKVRRIAEFLRDVKSRPEIKVAPSLSEILSEPAGGLRLAKVRPVDLLNREAVRLDLARIIQALAGKTVLVTGAGGTIGGELARQVLKHNPARLILLDNHATSLFRIEEELGPRSQPGVLRPVLGDARDAATLERLFALSSPDVVLHAAAHKHVPQLESNIEEGVANNVLGTWRLAEQSLRHGADTFVLVSTDKAVNPAGVMGATKRLAEMVVQDFARRGSTRFIAVRFGNVLGSSGSVLEIFERQLAGGGPLTVTHPEATRYFMTQEEAVQLILQAVVMARGGEIFVLKMGTPIRIIDIAMNLAVLSGLDPDRDVQIRFTGLRPGEKLTEELFEAGGAARQTDHPAILSVAQGNAAPSLEEALRRVERLCGGSDREALLGELRALVPSFPAAADGSRLGA